MTPVIHDIGAFFQTWMWAIVWKEEDALFPAIRPFIPREASPVAQMRLEHAELRKINEQFQSAIATHRADPGDREAMAAVRESGTRMVTFLRNHIPAEDEAVLTMADAHLGESQDQRILDAFKTIDADLAWGFENLQEFYP